MYLVTSLVAIYFSETSNICPVGVSNRKFDRRGSWFSKYFKTCQLFSLSNYATKTFHNHITLHNVSMLLIYMMLFTYMMSQTLYHNIHPI